MPDQNAASSWRPRWSRTALLRLPLAWAAALVLAACGGLARAGRPAQGEAPGAGEPEAAPATLPATPACADDDDDDPTPAQTEGPYFKRSSPQRASLLEAGVGGTRLVLTGRVLATDCRPVERALLDFWQADDRGQYDNTTFRLRGHQFTDGSGGFRLETVVPGRYPGRTRHIHVKVQAPGRPVLTTQLYFPGDPGNARDGLFDDRLLVEAQDAPAGTQAATFDFVLNLA